VFNQYSDVDTRIWTVLINPGQESVFITCRKIRDGFGNKNSLIPEFEINHDSVLRLQKHLKIRTLSMEVIINQLSHAGVTNDSELYRESDK
jgi:hypothetical protein